MPVLREKGEVTELVDLDKINKKELHTLKRHLLDNKHRVPEISFKEATETFTGFDVWYIGYPQRSHEKERSPRYIGEITGMEIKRGSIFFSTLRDDTLKDRNYFEVVRYYPQYNLYCDYTTSRWVILEDWGYCTKCKNKCKNKEITECPFFE